MSCRPQPAHRRGITIVVILGLISVTLALSYAILRTQITSSQIQANLTRGDNARQAAITGLSLALQEIHSSTWGGNDVTLTGNLNENDSYQVVFETGDPNLVSTDADYWKYPYRLTITSTGYSDDPSDISVRAMHTVKAVVQLVPRAFSSTPDGWLDAQSYSLNQWDDGKDVILEVPVHIEGDTRMQGSLELAETDLPDEHRTFNGAIDEVAIFSTALSAEQIDNIYDAAIGTSSPYSSLANGYASNLPMNWWRLNETAGAVAAIDTIGSQDGLYQFNAQPGITAGIDGTCVQLDGQYGHVELGSIDISGSAMTILAWIKADSFSPFEDARIVSKATGTENDDHFWMLRTRRDGTQMRLQFLLDAGGSLTELNSNTGGFVEGEWVFVAAVYDGTNMYLFENGVEVNSKGKSGTIATNADVPVWIGDNPPGSARGRYLADLQGMNLAAKGDYRPLTGSVSAPLSTWSGDAIALVRDNLDVTLIDIAADDTPPATHPGEVTTYQLYPGGEIYNAAALASSYSNATIEPNVITNPLGVLYRYGSVKLWSNNSIRGTMINNGGPGNDIKISEEGNELLPVEILPLDGDSSIYRLPTVIGSHDLKIEPNGGGRLEGLAVIFHKFEMKKASLGRTFVIDGRLMCYEFKAKGFTDFDLNGVWLTVLKDYLAQFIDWDDHSRVEFFPKWLEENYGLSPEPDLTIQPESEPVVYHWPDFSQPMYAIGEDDDGLRWDLLRWIDGD